MSGHRPTFSRLAFALLLALIAASCGKDHTAPASKELQLVVVTPNDAARALVIEISGGPMDIRPAPGYSIFSHASPDITRLILVAEDGSTLPKGETIVATVAGADPSSSLRISEVAGTDHQLRSLSGHSARLD